MEREEQEVIPMIDGSNPDTTYAETRRPSRQYSISIPDGREKTARRPSRQYSVRFSDQKEDVAEKRRSMLSQAETKEGEKEVLHEAAHDIDYLLSNLDGGPDRKLPGRYQLLVFASLCSCMFPVVFNDLCTMFYAIQPQSSACSLSRLNHKPSGDTFAERWLSSPESLNVRHSDLVNEVVMGVNGSQAVIVMNYSESAVCQRFDGLQGDQMEDCLSTMQHSFTYPRMRTVLSEWNFVCGRLWLGNLATTIYFAGVMAGSMAFGHFADKFGRKNCIFVCYLGYLPLGIALAFVPYYWLFLVLRCFIGFFIQGLQSVCFVLLMEYCAPKYREVVGGIQGSINNFGVIVLSTISYLLGDWRKIQLCVTLPTFLALSKFIFLRESLRWQMVHGKTEEVKDTSRKILQWNRLPASQHLNEVLDNHSAELQAQRQLQSNYSWIDCFRTPKIRSFTLVQSFLWFTTLFVYYGISFSIGELSGNVYVNAICGAAAEIPASVLAVILMKKLGRKKPLMLYYGLCGILCLLAGLLSFFINSHTKASHGDVFDVAVVRTLLVFAARFSLVGTLAIVFLYGSELFPTVIRNTAFGICICCHTAGGVVVPQVILLGHLVHDAVPYITFGFCSLLAAALVLTQPETLNRQMPDTIEQVEGTKRG